MEIKLIRTNSECLDFLKLNELLDVELAIRDGKDHVFYAQYNKVHKMNHIVLAFTNDEAVGCGAIKEHQNSIIEIK